MLDIHAPDWLDTAMQEASIRTGELAAASGVSRSQIQRIRNGMEPRLSTIRCLERALQQISVERSGIDPRPTACSLGSVSRTGKAA